MTMNEREREQLKKELTKEFARSGGKGRAKKYTSAQISQMAREAYKKRQMKLRGDLST